jgi:hypothetical protein
LDIHLSEHASRRSAQRNLSYDEILFVIEHGKRLRNAGVVFIQLRVKDIPEAIPANHHYRRLIGSTVVLCSCGQHVITLYREDEAFRKDKRKTKYNQQHQCALCSCTNNGAKVA